MFTPLEALEKFFKTEAAGGIVLIIASILAIMLANSTLAPVYNHFLDINFGLTFASLTFSKPLLFWINDALMVIFFFLVGLEIKREFLEGELSSVSKSILPFVAAFAGILAPAAIFYLINVETPENMRGWAIPAATDIAFALGILSLLRSKAPFSLKVFLTAVAIIDDLAAILIIALFYTGGIELTALMVGGVFVALLFFCNRYRVLALTPYVLIGIGLWVCIKIAGLHPTLAGVIVAFAIPLRATADPKSYSPVGHMEHALHPWVAFLVLPLFGFANAGVSFFGMTWADLIDPLTLGIAAGLFLGKQIGIFGASFLTVKLGFSDMPRHTNWWQIYGVSLLCGIGFTMSLFIGALAFPDVERAAALRLGVIMGSVVSAIVGFAVLWFAPQKDGMVSMADRGNLDKEIEELNERAFHQHKM